MKKMQDGGVVYDNLDEAKLYQLVVMALKVSEEVAARCGTLERGWRYWTPPEASWAALTPEQREATLRYEIHDTYNHKGCQVTAWPPTLDDVVAIAVATKAKEEAEEQAALAKAAAEREEQVQFLLTKAGLETVRRHLNRQTPDPRVVAYLPQLEAEAVAAWRAAYLGQAPWPDGNDRLYLDSYEVKRLDALGKLHNDAHARPASTADARVQAPARGLSCSPTGGATP